MNILGLGLPELIVIALILLLFFGPKRLPSLFRSIGSSVKELKDGLSTGEKTDTDAEPKVAKAEPAKNKSKVSKKEPANDESNTSAS